MNSQIKDYLVFCLNICNDVMGIYKEKLNKSNHITHKENRDVVTALDYNIEEFVRIKIQESYPMHSVYGEEYGYSEGGLFDYEWIIDPIDGTVNFINGLDIYAFSIALKYKGKTIVGAVLDLCNSVTYHAIRGGGSFKNGSLVKSFERTTKSKNELSVSLLLPQHYSSEVKIKNIELLHLFYENSLSVRVLTCHSLELIYLALGKFDSTICIKTKGISSAASLLFLEELNGEIYKSHYIIEDSDVFGIVACTKNSIDIIKEFIIKSGGQIENY